eukprot:m.32966 g.32966  ORF g.32966 m.32966 type:complete len:154 (+) comp14180_c0_seq2:167-628(+)
MHAALLEHILAAELEVFVQWFSFTGRKNNTGNTLITFDSTNTLTARVIRPVESSSSLRSSEIGGRRVTCVDDTKQSRKRVTILGKGAVVHMQGSPSIHRVIYRRNQTLKRVRRNPLACDCKRLAVEYGHTHCAAYRGSRSGATVFGGTGVERC